MSLIEELQVSLKDLWPEQPGGKLIRDRDGVAKVVVSSRLFSKMMHYAAEHRLDFGLVLDQLGAEIHRI